MSTSLFTRRSFLRKTALTGALLGAGDLGFRLPPVSAAEANLKPGAVQFNPAIEPLVRFLEETPRERLLEEAGSRIQRGLSYRDLQAALLLAGVRNIQPRPVSFKFHAVLVINSAHLASLSSPDADRWLPIFWALDRFKESQAQDVKEGDWTMGAVEESKVPPAHKAKLAFMEAMNNWDPAAADAAVVGLARTAGANELFEIFCRFGARDFREIGHKAIYVANSWRALQTIGWHHAEPVLRSLAYALLDYQGEHPASNDLPADRPWRRNLDLVRDIRSDWLEGKPDPGAAAELLLTLRLGSAADAAQKVVELLNRGTAPRSISDALFEGAGELIMRQPGIVGVHCVTSTNALHYGYQNSSNDETRKMLMLQAASFLTMFRQRMQTNLANLQIDTLEPMDAPANGAEAIQEIFAAVPQNRVTAARKTLGLLRRDAAAAQPLMAAGRRLIFTKGRDSHDYKFSSAALEDFYHTTPAWRERYMATAMFNLHGPGENDSPLLQRTRAALGA
jgi:hypothetical protein